VTPDDDGGGGDGGGDGGGRPARQRARFPASGTPGTAVAAAIAQERAGDLDWRGGRAFSLVYFVDDPDLEALQHEVAAEFLHENALNPFRYRTLLRMEGEVIDMACDLFGAAAGSLSSGGTESIFLAVQTARDHARANGNMAPELVCAETAHPAFAKACTYLDVRQIRTPTTPDGRADPRAFAEALGPRTALLVASAPCYPYGVVDPVDEIAGLAAQRGLLCHVDACLGGWLLPFWQRLGEPVPPWDLRVEGVTSLSADIHKYGYCFKGVSTVVYRDPELFGRQVFMYDEWPGGLYASASSAGTRPGPPIAAAWATITHLGAEGYLRLAGRVRDATRTAVTGIEAIDGLRVHPQPDMSVLQFQADPDSSVAVDIAAVGDGMDARGWNLDRQQGGLHLMLSPGHDRVMGDFVADLAAAVAEGGTGSGAAHTYGGVVQR
jgi:glutamate/tyrosine decarboxylase-like PLP-dependent enzyme